MAKSHNQKAKILYLAQMLRETGENRVLSMQEILAGLLEYGIQAERKSIYDDVEALRDFGMDIKFKRGRPGGYYLAGQIVPEQAEKPEDANEEEASGEQADSVDNGSGMEEITETAPGTDWKFARGDTAGEKPMKLLCSNRLMGDVKEYFGRKAEYKDKGTGYFTVTTGQLGNPQFFGWLTAMGKDVHILKPRKTAQAYRDYLKSLAKEYKGI